MSENLLMGITVLLHSVVSPLCRKVSASLKKSLTYSTVLLSSSFEQNAGTSLKNLLQDEEQGGCGRTLYSERDASESNWLFVLLILSQLS